MGGDSKEAMNAGAVIVIKCDVCLRNIDRRSGPVYYLRGNNVVLCRNCRSTALSIIHYFDCFVAAEQAIQRAQEIEPQTFLDECEEGIKCWN